MPAKKKAGRLGADKPRPSDELDTNPMRSEQAAEAVSSSSPQDQSLIREGHITSSPTTLAQQPVGARSAAPTLSTTTISEAQGPAHIDPPASTGTEAYSESATATVPAPHRPSDSTPRAETAQTKPAPPSSEAAVSSGTPESPKAAVAPADAEPPKAEEVAAHSATPLISWSATGLQFTPAQRAAAAAGLPDPGANASTLEPPVSTAGNPMAQAQATSAADAATVSATTRVASTTSSAAADVSSQDVEAAPATVTTPLTSSAVGAMMEGARAATTPATPTWAPETGATSSHEERVDATQPASLADATQTEAPQMPNYVEGTFIGESLRLAGLISADISDDRITGDGGSRGPFLDAAGSDPTSAFSVDSPTGDVTFKSDIGTHSAFAADTRVSSGGSTSGRGFAKEQLEQEATNQQLGIDSGMDYQELAKQANEDKSLDALDRAEIAQEVGGEPTEADQAEAEVASEATEVVSETPVEDDEPTDGTATAMPNPEDPDSVTPATAEAAAWFLRAVLPDDNTKSSLANPGLDEFGTQSGVHIGELPPDARLSPYSNPDPGDDSALGSADPPTFENTLTNPGPDLGLGGWTPDSGSPNSPGTAVGNEDD